MLDGEMMLAPLTLFDTVLGVVTAVVDRVTLAEAEDEEAD